MRELWQGGWRQSQQAGVYLCNRSHSAGLVRSDCRNDTEWHGSVTINTETSPGRALELLCSPKMNLCTKPHQNSVVHNVNITHVYPTCKCSDPLWRFCFRLWVQFKAASQIPLVNAVSQNHANVSEKKTLHFLIFHWQTHYIIKHSINVNDNVSAHPSKRSQKVTRRRLRYLMRLQGGGLGKENGNPICLRMAVQRHKWVTMETPWMRTRD